MSAVSRRPGLKIKAVVLFLLYGLIWSGVCFAAPLYTVEIGKFKALPAAKALFDKLPPPFTDQAFITHSGINYRVCCGKAQKQEELEPLFSSLKDFNVTPAIIQIDSGDCLPVAGNSPSMPEAAAVSPPKTAPPVRTIPEHHVAPKAKKERYADMKKKDVKRYLAANGNLIMPESATKIFLSNRDINRLTCSNGPVKDIVYSKEKGINVKTDGDNAFVKFLISRDPVTGGFLYADTPSEFYVVCGDSSVYTLIASPKDIPAQTVRLVSRTKEIKKRVSLFEGLPFEKKILMLVKAAYTDNIPQSLTIKPLNQEMNLFRDIGIFLQREVVADGEGLLLKEYVLSLKASSAKKELPIEEKFFLLPEIAQHPVGISLERQTLKKGRSVRLFVVEKREI